MLNAVIIIVALALGGYLAFSRRWAASSNWKATVTPLASIMGSGFLVSAPLLAGIVGNLAVVCMALLLVLAYMVGGAIRFNIRHFEPIENKGHGPAQDIAFLSRIVLVGAYFISVTYYLQLLAAFVLKAVGVHSPVAANGITTLLLLAIGGQPVGNPALEPARFHQIDLGVHRQLAGRVLVFAGRITNCVCAKCVRVLVLNISNDRLEIISVEGGLEDDLDLLEDTPID